MTKLYNWFRSVFSADLAENLEAETIDDDSIENAVNKTTTQLENTFGFAGFYFGDKLSQDKNLVNDTAQAILDSCDYEHPSIAAGGWGNY